MRLAVFNGLCLKKYPFPLHQLSGSCPIQWLLDIEPVDGSEMSVLISIMLPLTSFALFGNDPV